jgi:hypothetical protein
MYSSERRNQRSEEADGNRDAGKWASSPLHQLSSPTELPRKRHLSAFSQRKLEASKRRDLRTLCRCGMM